jgi:hypothetical protein
LNSRGRTLHLRCDTLQKALNNGPNFPAFGRATARGSSDIPHEIVVAATPAGSPTPWEGRRRRMTG